MDRQKDRPNGQGWKTETQVNKTDRQYVTGRAGKTESSDKKTD